MLRLVDIADALALALELADLADAITMARFRAARPAGHDQARPHTGERGRPGRRAGDPRAARGDDRPRGARRGVRRPRAGRRRRVPLDHRPDRRHEELRARRPDLGDAHRARARGRARRRRRVGARARHALVGRARASARSATASASRVSSVVVARRRADLVRVGHRGALRGRRHRRQACSRSSHRCWRTRGIGDFWQHVLVAEGAFDIAIDPIVSLWDVAALVPIIEEAGGRWSTLDGRADAARRQLRVHERPAARRRPRRARRRHRQVASGSMPPSNSDLTVGIDIGTSSVKAVAADADGNVVARSRIPHEFYVPSPLRFEHDAADGVARTGRSRALDALGDVDAARRVGRGDGAVADRGRRRRRAVHARPALRRRARATEHGSDAIAEAGELVQFLQLAAAASGPTRAATGWRRPSRTTRSRARPIDLDHRRGDRVPALRLDGGWDADAARRRAARAPSRCREIGIAGPAARRGDGPTRLRARRRHDRRDRRADRRRAPTRSATCS